MHIYETAKNVMHSHLWTNS